MIFSRISSMEDVNGEFAIGNLLRVDESDRNKNGHNKFPFIFPGEGGSRCDDLHRGAEQVDEGAAFHGAQLRACGRGM